MKYQVFSSGENLVSSEDTIFIFHTVKISFLFDNIFGLLTTLKFLVYDRNVIVSYLFWSFNNLWNVIKLSCLVL